jgi:hypothetical protein
LEGTYDPSSHTYNHTSETEPERGKKAKVREQIYARDRNHYHLDSYDEHAGREVKRIEIDYTREARNHELWHVGIGWSSASLGERGGA